MDGQETEVIIKCIKKYPHLDERFILLILGLIYDH